MEEQEIINQRLKVALTTTINVGYQLDGTAFAILKTLAQTKDLNEILEATIEKASKLKDRPLFITSEMIEEAVKASATEDEDPTTISEGVARAFNPPAKDMEADIEVISDPTDKVSSAGDIGDFLKYFRDRFTHI
jgi:DNA polymerase II small subunit/DNA polymerase delta subunit B